MYFWKRRDGIEYRTSLQENEKEKVFNRLLLLPTKRPLWLAHWSILCRLLLPLPHSGRWKLKSSNFERPKLFLSVRNFFVLSFASQNLSRSLFLSHSSSLSLLIKLSIFLPSPPPPYLSLSLFYLSLSQSKYVSLTLFLILCLSQSVLINHLFISLFFFSIKNVYFLKTILFDAFFCFCFFFNDPLVSMSGGTLIESQNKASIVEDHKFTFDSLPWEIFQK